MNNAALTPIQRINGLTLKRDDLYQPFGAGEVNGGKLRQCMMLAESIQGQGYKGLISCCSIHSPQAPITAAVAQHFGMSCQILYGGTSKDTVKALPMPRLAAWYGARITIAAKSGRHAVLYAKAREIAEREGYFVVLYGINLTGHADVLLGAVSQQVQNIPDGIENLIITCGSGITAAGILLGLSIYSIPVKTIHLVATAPDRRQLIHSILSEHGADREFEYHDLFHTKGFSYEKPYSFTWGGIRLHPNYEAKTMAWFSRSGIDREKTLFWITGAEPTVFLAPERGEGRAKKDT